MFLQTYCSLGKVYDAIPGGGEAIPGGEGYLKTVAVCAGGAKVFFDKVLGPVAGIVCGVGYGCWGRNDRGGLIGGE